MCHAYCLATWERTEKTQKSGRSQLLAVRYVYDDVDQRKVLIGRSCSLAVRVHDRITGNFDLADHVGHLGISREES